MTLTAHLIILQIGGGNLTTSSFSTPDCAMGTEPPSESKLNLSVDSRPFDERRDAQHVGKLRCVETKTPRKGFYGGWRGGGGCGPYQ